MVFPKKSKNDNSLSESGLARRKFIVSGAAIGGGLLIGFAVPKFMNGKFGSEAAKLETFEFKPNAFIKIDETGKVTLTMSKAEMGQGTFTSLTMLISEELEVDPKSVVLEQAPADDKNYGDPILGAQITGASTSVRGAWDPMRKAGATARTLLISAACKVWQVNAQDCYAENGYVFQRHSAAKLGYGELASIAASLPTPENIKLKEPGDFKLIGKPVKRLDSPIKVNGQAQYGIDMQLPNMKIATVAMSPVLGGKVSKLNESKALAVRGVQKVIRLDDVVAVIADHMWAAKQGLAALEIEWDEGQYANVMMKDILRDLENASNGTKREHKSAVAVSEGDFKSKFASSPVKFEASYQVPFLAHAAIEPMNATVHVQKSRCDVWVGTQVPSIAKGSVVKLTGLAPDNVFVHNQHIGGGFGRRLDIDFINQAVAIAKHVDYPVKVVWTREEDMQHGMYRPYYFDKLSAGLDKNGKLIAWQHRVTGSSIMSRWAPAYVQNGLDSDAVEVAKEPLYAPENLFVEYVRQEPTVISTGWWRGVGPAHNTFMIESFIDELAHKFNIDPVEYRLSMLDKSPRAKHVLETAAKKANWGAPLKDGYGRGVSLQYAFGTYLAQVSDVFIEDDEVKVKRVVCVVDCGMVVNPDHIKAQMEGGINFGISGALWGEITIKNGRVEQSSFDTYRVMRMNEMPEIEVHIVNSLEAPGGIGEPGTAALAPSLTNAIYAATGKRIRKLPIASNFAEA